MLISKDKCDKLTDRQMILKALEDVDYFTCMYLRYESQLKRYILKISKVTPQEAEDILQEAYIKIWRNLNAIDPSMKLSSWLYRIIYNQTISNWRKKKGAAIITLDEKVAQTIFEDLENKDSEEINDRAVQKAINGLPAKYKDVIILKYFENMNYEEISDILKIPEGTVAVRLNRAKKAIKKALH